ncbi:glycerol-3-phosphate dehydrogenase subunit GlpB [Oceanidesulfovibrio indonesiensis]|nr:glycerol-3-phosphate dehydrogenase subunit GlpB [Oceanidesulfovibrio indonesiensis]
MPTASTMKRRDPDCSCDLMVVGAGMAGMAAALFASARGLSVAQAGGLGGIDFSTGMLDLLGMHPATQNRDVDDPWRALEELAHDEPHHPYAFVAQQDIRAAFDEFTNFLARAGLPYEGYADRNADVLTSLGTKKRTYRAPRSMWAGVQAMHKKLPCLVVDFKGLKGFSGRQIREIRGADWPKLRAVRIQFPGCAGELYPEHLAWSLTEMDVADMLADAVAEHVREAQAVGFPAVLGLYAAPEHAPGNSGKGDVRPGVYDVLARLQSRLGVPVFEIPTLPPSMAGLRLRAAFETFLQPAGVRMYPQKLVSEWERLADGDFRLHIAGAGDGGTEAIVHAKGVILAGGRFFGKGLVADRHAVREPLFGLPVLQPHNRAEWHRDDFFDPRGHPLNRTGVEVDKRLRPLSENGRPAFSNLFAAGSILAHQDWMRAKCGAGLAIATAYAAVQSFLDR